VNGNTATNTAQVTVKDCMAPVVKCKPLTVYLYENGEYVLNKWDIERMSIGDDVIGWTWDNCTPYEEMVIEIFPRSFECVHVNGPVPVTVYATDVSGNTGMCETYVIVMDTIAPVMSCKDIDVYLDANGEAYIFPGDLNNAGDRESVPKWARTFNDLEGGSYDACGIDSAWVSQYKFDCGDIGANTVTLYMKDPSNNTSMCTSKVTVHDDIPPVIAPIANITVEVAPGVCETKITYPTLSATDNCEWTAAQTAGLGPDGMFPLGTTTETWVVTDDGGNSAEVSFTVTVTTTNAPPTLDAIADVEVDEDTPSVNVPLSGISYGVDCEAQDVTVTAVITKSGLITGVVVNHTPGAATGSVDVTIAPEMSGEAEITVTVEDSEGGMVSESFMVTVNPVNDPPFLVTPVADQTVNASYALDVTISSVLGVMFDDIDDASLTISVMKEGGGALPAWATMVGDVLKCTPMIGDTGSVMIVVKATDAAGATVTDTFKITVEGYPVSIDELGAGLFEVNMYPNPTRGEVNLDIKAAGIYDVNLSVVDITGRTVLNRMFSASENIVFDMSGKVSGMYFVHLNLDGKQIVKKLVVDRK
jgi:hypothetical protein